MSIITLVKNIRGGHQGSVQMLNNLLDTCRVALIDGKISVLVYAGFSKSDIPFYLRISASEIEYEAEVCFS